MKRNICMAWCAVLSLAGSAWGQAVPFVTPPNYLRVESQVAPIGVGVENPRFSWEFKSPVAGETQTAYRIVVASGRDQLGAADLWDSGKVLSDQTFQIPYAGKALKSGQHVYWSVTVWNTRGQALSPIDPSQFSMGILQPADWTARWIAFTNDDANLVNEPAPCFRKEFTLDHRIERAVVHVCGLGQYELSINGKKVGDSVLAPAWTMYSKTCAYDSYDVTAQIKEGPNAVGVMLGNGMYNVLRLPGRYTKFPLANEPKGNGSMGVPKLILQLDVAFADGTHEIIASDASWKAARGPVTTNHIYGGEDYDARLEMPDWNTAGFDATPWKSAEITKAPGDGAAQLVANVTPLSKVAKEYPTVKTTALAGKPGTYIYDLGQNLAGWPHLKIKGPAGSVVKLIPGELLDRNGAVTQASSGSPVWFSYTLKGDPAGEDWQPKFSYYGFRYVQVEGAVPPDVISNMPRLTELTSEFVHADLPVVGSFTSSDKTLNDIHALINTAILSNAQSLLTDCPHREKLGWLEQTHLMGDAIAMNYDVSGLYAKMCRDMRDSQQPNGLVPDIAPEYTTFSGGFRDSPEWGSAAVIDPWLLYQYYGDTRTPEAQYDAMKKYVAFLGTTAKGNIISHGLGDWYDIGPAKPGKAQLTSLGLTSTATYYQDLEILRKTAALLHHDDDARMYTALAADVRTAFNAQFLNVATSEYEKGSQTANAMPLALGLVEPAQQSAVLNKLVASLRANQNHVTAGDVGFSYVVRALTDFNQGDAMYDLMTQSDGPGYVDQLKKGATSLTEAWAALPASSQNHLMLGHAEAWLYRGLAGIQNAPGSVAFHDIWIKPQVPAGLQAIKGKAWVNATYRSERGEIASRWICEGKHLQLIVTIPPTSTATIWVPAADGVQASITGDNSALVQPRAGAEKNAFTAPAGTFVFESVLP